MAQNMAVTTLSLLAHEAVHLGSGAIGALGAISGVMVAVVTLVLSRRVPHQRAAMSAAAGMGALVMSLLVLASAPSFGVLVAGVVLLGASGGVTMPGLLNAVVSEAGGQRERAIAIYTVVLSISLAVGPLLETLILSIAHQAVRIPFVVFAVFPFLGAPLAIVAGRRQRPSLPSRVGQTEPIADQDAGLVPTDLVVEVSIDEVAAVGLDRTNPLVGTEGLHEQQRKSGLLSTHAGRMALVAQLLYGVPFAGITVFGALVARVGFGFSPAEAQLGFTVFFVVSFVARAAVAWRAPVTHKRGLLTVSAAMTVAGLLLLGLGRGGWALYLAMGALGIPHGLTFPLALSLVAEATPIAALPRVNATLLGIGNITTVIVPLILGSIIIPAIGYQNMTLVLLAPVLAFTAIHVRLGSGPTAGKNQAHPL